MILMNNCIHATYTIQFHLRAKYDGQQGTPHLGLLYDKCSTTTPLLTVLHNSQNTYRGHYQT